MFDCGDRMLIVATFGLIVSIAILIVAIFGLIVALVPPYVFKVSPLCVPGLFASDVAQKFPEAGLAGFQKCSPASEASLGGRRTLLNTCDAGLEKILNRI